MSTLAAAPQGAAPGDPGAGPQLTRSRRPSVDALVGLCVTAGLVAVAFVTSGGVDQTAASPGSTWTEIILTLAGAGALLAAILGGARGRAWGAGTVALMAALAALTGLSIVWSVVPDTSWSAANQMLSYLATFAGAAALARLAPDRWPALLGAIAISAAALSGWALLAKVFPVTLAAAHTTARLQAPFGYWNAVGLSGALGLPAALWVGARRDRGRLLAGLSAPALTLMLTVEVLSYSRSADAAAVIAIVGWMLLVPLRLRSAVLLAIAATGAAGISVYALGTSALTSDSASFAAQDSAGHSFGVVLLVALALVTVAGLIAARAMDRTTVSPMTRRRIGRVLVIGACLVPIAAIGAVASSSRGLTGEISHGWSQLTSSHAVVYDNPGRVFQFGSSRPVYWHEGIDVGEQAVFKGVGASGFGTARLRYTTDRYKVDQAHSYVFETFADLGLIGIAVSLALLIAWAVAASRPLAPRTPWRSLAGPRRAEREGMVALGLIVLAFGIQSTLDWTWYFPGVSVPVLLCAGWLAGRGPLSQRIGWRHARRSLLDRPGAVALAATILLVALAGGWAQWQPLRSEQSYQASLNTSNNPQAFADARTAIDRDPLAYQPRFWLAQLYRSVNDIASAREQLVKATQTQPQNPLTWIQLGTLASQTGQLRLTLTAMRRALALYHSPDSTRASILGTIQHAQLELSRVKAPAG